MVSLLCVKEWVVFIEIWIHVVSKAAVEVYIVVKALGGLVSPAYHACVHVAPRNVLRTKIPASFSRH
jgi:hypothetical protein